MRFVQLFGVYGGVILSGCAEYDVLQINLDKLIYPIIIPSLCAIACWNVLQFLKNN